MFSVTYTGMNLFPLCTANVCPTNSGRIVLARDQVFTTFFSLRPFMAITLDSRRSAMNGPFLMLLDISALGSPFGYCVARPRLRPRTMRRCEDFFLLRVLT